MRILLVDDNPDDRALVRREAEALFPEAELLEAGSRDDFEAAIRAARYELVVTDLHLNWGNGREIVSTVRQNYPDCAIVMFTGTGDEMTAVELMKSGLDDYVVKAARQLPRLRASMNLAVQNARQRSALSERERQLTAALAHKDMLVGELHHRVKNNLQTIVALLDLRARQTDSGTAEELRDLAARMRALARVQARIYETQSLDRVDFTATLAEMVVELVKVYGEDRIKPALSLADPVRLEVGRAMPLALLCYEVLLNALKHAWPGGRDGMLSVQMKRSGEAVELRIVDDGVGFESGQVNKGFGSRLTPALAREADSDLSIESRPGSGTTVTIRLA